MAIKDEWVDDDWIDLPETETKKPSNIGGFVGTFLQNILKDVGNIKEAGKELAKLATTGETTSGATIKDVAYGAIEPFADVMKKFTGEKLTPEEESKVGQRLGETGETIKKYTVGLPQTFYEEPLTTAAVVAPMAKPVFGIAKGITKTAVSPIAKLATGFKNLRLPATELAPKVVNAAKTAEIGLRTSFGNGLKQIDVVNPNGVTFKKLHEFVAKNLDKKAQKIIDDIDEISNMSKVNEPFGGYTAVEAQELKNKITTQINQKILEGKIKPGQIDVRKLAKAIDEDMVRDLSGYSDLKTTFEIGVKDMAKLKALKDPDKLINFIRNAFRKGANPEKELAIVRQLPPEIVNEVYQYADFWNALNKKKLSIAGLETQSVAQLLTKRITPKNIKKLTKNPPKG